MAYFYKSIFIYRIVNLKLFVEDKVKKNQLSETRLVCISLSQDVEVREFWFVV